MILAKVSPRLKILKNKFIIDRRSLEELYFSYIRPLLDPHLGQHFLRISPKTRKNSTLKRQELGHELPDWHAQQLND